MDSLDIKNKIGRVARENPKALTTVVSKYDATVNDDSSVQEVASSIVRLSNSNEAFKKDLAKLLLQEDPTLSKEVRTGYEVDNYDGGPPTAGAPPLPTGGDVTVGADPISAIAGAIGSIFSFASAHTDAKSMEKAQRDQLILTLMQPDPAILAAQKRKTTIMVVSIVGIFVIAALVLFFVLRKKKK